MPDFIQVGQRSINATFKEFKITKLLKLKERPKTRSLSQHGLNYLQLQIKSKQIK
jgi:hypothetical protein